MVARLHVHIISMLNLHHHREYREIKGFSKEIRLNLEDQSFGYKSHAINLSTFPHINILIFSDPT